MFAAQKAVIMWEACGNAPRPITQSTFYSPKRRQIIALIRNYLPTSSSVSLFPLVPSEKKRKDKQNRSTRKLTRESAIDWTIRAID